MKRVVLWSVLGTGLAIGSMMVTRTTVQGRVAGGESPAAELALSPVPLSLKGLNRGLVARGSYLVNAASGCNDCHTYPSYAAGGDPFLGQPAVINAAGYMLGGRPFGPGIVSRSLRPELPSKKPFGRTYSEFVETMRKGTDLDMAHPEISPLLQVMPWPAYGDMSDLDLRAIYEYLRALPPIQPTD